MANRPKKLSISKQYKDKYEIWMNAIYHGGGSNCATINLRILAGFKG